MESFIRKVCLQWVNLAGILLFAVVLVTVLNIGAFGLDRIARHFGTTVEGLPGYEDFVRLSMSCIALMFFPLTQLERGHVSVDFFVGKLSTKTQVFIDKIWLSVTFCVVVFLGIYMYKGMLESYEDEAVSSVLGWIEWPFYIPGIISLFMWAVVLVYQVVFKKRSLEND